jgi:hypothetical protein
MAKDSVSKRILLKIIGFLIFLIILGLANFLTKYITDLFYGDVVNFLIENLWLSFLIFVSTLVAEIFWMMWFPLDIPAPFLSAVSSLFIVNYLYNIYLFLGVYTYIDAPIPIGSIYEIVFWMVIGVGYILLLARIAKDVREKKKGVENQERGKRERKQDENEEKKSSGIEWNDVGGQFRLGCYNIGKAFNGLFEKRNKK